MHVGKKIQQTWLSKYKIKQVYFKDKNYLKTLKFLKKQKYLKYSKVYFLLNSFINKNYPICNILVNENKIVGFVGTIFSKKKFNNKNYLTCNIHSWLVDRDHRIASSLLFHQINKKKCLITVLSSLPRLRNTFIRLGFKEFIMKYKIILVNKIFFKKTELKYEIFDNFDKIRKIISKKLAGIALNYSNNKYQKLLFIDFETNEYCFIIGNLVLKKKYFKTLNIIFCSNKNFLNKNSKQFFRILAKNFNISLCGEYFLNKNYSIFKYNGNFSLIKNKKIFLKKIPNKFIFDLLFSETEF